jgi:hypothetical protein
MPATGAELAAGAGCNVVFSAPASGSRVTRMLRHLLHHSMFASAATFLKLAHGVQH